MLGRAADLITPETGLETGECDPLSEHHAHHFDGGLACRCECAQRGAPVVLQVERSYGSLI